MKRRCLRRLAPVDGYFPAKYLSIPASFFRYDNVELNAEKSWMRLLSVRFRWGDFQGSEPLRSRLSFRPKSSPTFVARTFSIHGHH